MGDHRTARAPFQIDADGVADAGVEPELGHGRSVRVVDHERREFDVPGEFLQRQTGIADDLPEGDRAAVRGDYALDGEGDAEHLASRTHHTPREFGDEIADHIVVVAGVAVGDALAFAGDHLAVQVHRHQRDAVRAHPHADRRMRFRGEHVGLRLASAGRFRRLASSDQSLILKVTQIGGDGGQAQPEGHLQMLLGGRAMPVQMVDYRLTVGLFDRCGWHGLHDVSFPFRASLPM